MNYAVLRKVRVVEANNSQDVILSIRKNLRQSANPNFTESALYLSNLNSRTYYNLSFFWALPAPQELEELFGLNSAPSLKTKKELISQQTFRLISDQRTLTRQPVASFLRILTFPESYSDAQINARLANSRRIRKILASVTGTWMGQALDDHRRVIIRSDWNEFEALQEFFSSPFYLTMLENDRQDEITVEHASYQLQSLSTPETGSAQSSRLNHLP